MTRCDLCCWNSQFTRCLSERKNVPQDEKYSVWINFVLTAASFEAAWNLHLVTLFFFFLLFLVPLCWFVLQTPCMTWRKEEQDASCDRSGARHTPTTSNRVNCTRTMGFLIPNKTEVWHPADNQIPQEIRLWHFARLHECCNSEKKFCLIHFYWCIPNILTCIQRRKHIFLHVQGFLNFVFCVGDQLIFSLGKHRGGIIE